MSNIKEFQSFLGLINWFKDFIPDYPDVALPLTKLLVDSAYWDWTEAQQVALEVLVDRIQSQPILRHFDLSKRAVVFKDASDYAIGGWIGQELEDSTNIKPVVFWSRKLRKAELNYAIPEKELLEIIALTEAHRPYVSGTEVVVKTDHKPLIWLQKQHTLSPRQARWITKLQELNLKIEYLPGKLKCVANKLSRQPVVSPKCSVYAGRILDYDPGETMAEVTAIEGQSVDIQAFDLEGDLERQRQVLRECHVSATAGQSGTKRTLEKVSRFSSERKMSQDTSAYVRSCDSCQRNKSRTCKPLDLLTFLPVPEARFSCIGIGWFYLPRTDNGLEIIVDYFTKLTVSIPCKSTDSSQDMATLFKQHLVDQGFGIPAVMISDRDGKSTSKFWKSLCQSLGIHLNLATARHQQTNGQAERTIRVVKTTLLSLLEYDTTRWPRFLSSVLFALNDSVNVTTGQTPFMLTLGQHAKDPFFLPGEPHPWV